MSTNQNTLLAGIIPKLAPYMLSVFWTSYGESSFTRMEGAIKSSGLIFLTKKTKLGKINIVKSGIDALRADGGEN